MDVHEKEKEIRVSEHSLVPQHEVLSKEEKAEIMKRFNITEHQLPKIHAQDPAAKEIGAKNGDVIKITRKSPTTGKTVYYRLVIGGGYEE